MKITRRTFIEGMGAVAGASSLPFTLPAIAQAATRAERAAKMAAANPPRRRR